VEVKYTQEKLEPGNIKMQDQFYIVSASVFPHKDEEYIGLFSHKKVAERVAKIVRDIYRGLNGGGINVRSGCYVGQIVRLGNGVWVYGDDSGNIQPVYEKMNRKEWLTVINHPIFQTAMKPKLTEEDENLDMSGDFYV
jgi:hypothetical protein